ncbi:hypothetical protein FHG87_000992 [Trinorchestia longiramus]|nr:hypothetical protein FHG87_000992 [Trinorchestia longiramus]
MNDSLHFLVLHCNAAFITFILHESPEAHDHSHIPHLIVSSPVPPIELSLNDERSRSGSSAQPTTLFNEATALGVTDSPPSASKVNISSKNSHHLQKSTQPTAEQRKQKPTILSADRMGFNNSRTIKTCVAKNEELTSYSNV